MAKSSTKKSETVGDDKVHIEVEGPDLKRATIHIRGFLGSPLMANKIPDSFLDAPPGSTVKGAPRRVDTRTPKQVAESCLHLNDKKQACVPVDGIARAVQTAAGRFGDNRKLNRKSIAGAMRVLSPDGSPLIPIKGNWVVDTRWGRRPARTGTPCKLHRPRWDQWQLAFDVLYDARLLTIGQIHQIVATAGFSIGLQDGRVETGYNNGMFELAEKGKAA